MKTVIMIILVMLNVSCRKTLMIAYGIRQPKIESNESLNRYLSNAGINDTLLLHVDSSSSYSLTEELFSASLPKIEFYNAKGEMVTELWESECSVVQERQFKTLNFDTMKVIPDAPKLHQTMKMFQTKSGRKLDASELKGETATVCMYYSKALGRLSTESLNRWTKGLSEHQEFNKLKILYLNVDMHKDWGIQSRKDSRRMRFEYN